MVGCLCFAAFASFWTNLAFLLSTPHYHLGAGAAGSFGVLGAAGALAASIAGRVADKRGARFVVLSGILLLSSAYVVLWVAGYWMAGLIIGVLVLDMGQQTMHIGNQTRIFSLVEGARSRLNTVYMIVFFLGGAAGSAASTWAWSHWQWTGVCAMALMFLAAALAVHAMGARRRMATAVA
jgi:predicted MFS family arabinose efflux permease